MKQLSILIVFIVSIISCKKSDSGSTSPIVTPPSTDSFTVSVNNGYGAGKYKVGDTVHIFSNHYNNTNQLFDTWSGDTTLLYAPKEYHSWFIMPNRNVSFVGSIKTIAMFTLQYEQIRGRDRLKPVYYYFPSGHTGFVYLLHGSNGKASFVVNEYEFQQLIKDIVSNNLGVIVTEAEEATTGIDANNDGALRWAIFPVDSVLNVDYANIKIITDTFYNRGLTNRSKLRYSVGMSNGGFYSASLSGYFRHKAGVSYCAQGDASIMQNTQTPVQYCMARNDDNSNIGPTGNATALTYYNALNARSVCSKYFIKERCPIYTERFARRGDITTAQSVLVFNELKAKGYIDNQNFYIGTSSAALGTAFLDNPTSFPTLNSLNASQRSFIQDQIDLCISNHQMYSDYNRATLRFINTQCL